MIKGSLIKTKELLKYNLKVLTTFEVIYRLIGLFLIFPLGRWIFHLSFSVAGYTYVTNQQLLDYLFAPTTILLLLLILILVAIYITFELIILTVIFDFSHHQKKIDILTLLRVSLKIVAKTFKNYHVFAIGNGLLFFIVMQLFYFTAISSTFELPEQITTLLSFHWGIEIGFYLILLGLVVYFIHSLFSLHLMVLDKLGFKKRHQMDKQLLNKSYLRYFLGFVVMIIIINIIFFLIYWIIILLVSLVVTLSRGQAQVLGIVLGMLYGIYIFVGFVSSIFLIPLQMALISALYYSHKADQELFSIPVIIKESKTPFLSKRQTRAILISITLFILLINIPTMIAVVQDTQNRLEILNHAEIIAHRGSSWDAPENTLAAFELALEQGVDAIEIDVQETVDHIPIVIHDSRTGRTTNDSQNRYVHNLTFDEIRALDAGSWLHEDFTGQQVPSLEEVLLLVKGETTLFIELKSQSLTLEKSVLDLIDLYEMENEVVILSFQLGQLARMKQANEDLKTLLLLSSFAGNFSQLIANRNIDYFGFSRVMANLNSDFIQMIHERGKKVYVYTLNQESHINDAVHLNVNGIITDRPIIAREIAQSKNKSNLITQIILRLFSQ